VFDNVGPCSLTVTPGVRTVHPIVKTVTSLKPPCNTEVEVACLNLEGTWRNG
jgi:hypothetical protein